MATASIPLQDIGILCGLATTQIPAPGVPRVRPDQRLPWRTMRRRWVASVVTDDLASAFDAMLLSLHAIALHR